jgi:hypothetical protein
MTGGDTLGITVLEQRKNKRFDLRLPMEILGNAARAHKPEAKSETRNVSSCGVLFTCKSPVGIGETIEYMITLPKAPGARASVRLRCIGTVVRNAAVTYFAATMERYEFVREGA